jgi:hypothetical protein
MITKTKQTKKAINRWLKRKRQNKYNYYKQFNATDKVIDNYQVEIEIYGNY